MTPTPPTTAPPPPSRWPLALLSFGLGSLLTGGLAVALFLSLYRPGPPPAGDGVDRPVLPRTEFTHRVKDKSEAEVVAAVGKPDNTSEDGGAKFWHYKRRTKDPETNAIDTDVQVILQDGKVTNINY